MSHNIRSPFDVPMPVRHTIVEVGTDNWISVDRFGHQENGGPDFDVLFNAVAALGGSIDLSLEGQVSYDSPLVIGRHGTQIFAPTNHSGDPALRLNYTGAGSALTTVADAGGFLAGVGLHNVFITSATGAVGLDIYDVLNFKAYNCQVNGMIAAGAIAIALQTDLYSPVLVDFFHTFIQNCRNGIRLNAGSQVGIFQSQITGMAGPPAGSVGIFQGATVVQLTITGPTLNLFETCQQMEGDQWVCINPQWENATRGIRCPNMFYRAALINPLYAGTVTTPFTMVGGQRCSMLNSESGDWTTIGTKAGAVGNADFYWARRVGFIHDSVNNRLYFVDAGGNIRWIACT